MWWMPKDSVSIRRTRPTARWPVYVGHPTWSCTTTTGPPLWPRRSIVSTKFPPFGPNSHEVRTMKLRLVARAVARSPASLVRPYALIGAVSSFSV
jgi:hypothetical protein